MEAHKEEGKLGNLLPVQSSMMLMHQNKQTNGIGYEQWGPRVLKILVFGHFYYCKYEKDAWYLQSVHEYSLLLKKET